MFKISLGVRLAIFPPNFENEMGFGFPVNSIFVPVAKKKL